jgi:hypothetical protein
MQGRYMGSHITKIDLEVMTVANSCLQATAGADLLAGPTPTRARRA